MKYNFNSEELVNLDQQIKIANYTVKIYANKHKLRTITFKIDNKAIGCSQNYNFICAIEDAAENVMEESLSFDKFIGAKGEIIPDSNTDQLLLDGYKIKITPFLKPIGEAQIPFLKITMKKKNDKIFSATFENLEEALNEIEEVGEELNNHSRFQKTLMNYKMKRNSKYRM